MEKSATQTVTDIFAILKECGDLLGAQAVIECNRTWSGDEKPDMPRAEDAAKTLAGVLEILTKLERRLRKGTARELIDEANRHFAALDTGIRFQMIDDSKTGKPSAQLVFEGGELKLCDPRKD